MSNEGLREKIREELRTRNVPLVIYHGGCMDGFTAAWVASQYLPESELRGMAYTDEPPDDEDVRDRRVYIVDFSFKRDVCERIHEKARRLTILDHHKTAEAELQGLPYADFDMEQSGAGMTWDYFANGYPRPWLVDYVEDRDLWRFKLPDSKEVNAGIATTPMTLEAWDGLHRQGLDRTREIGRGALAFESMCADKAAKEARVIRFEGYDVPFVNTQYQLASVTAGKLAEDAPFAVAWFQKGDGKIQYSLRSRGEDAVDVSEIAKRWGGGGHRNAAGFTVDVFPDEL